MIVIQTTYLSFFYSIQAHNFRSKTKQTKLLEQIYFVSFVFLYL